MRVETHPHEVRKLVFETLEALGARLESRLDIEETILIHGGRYAARSYRAAKLMAMWLVDVGLVQFYDADGTLLCTISLSEKPEPLKMAA